MPEDFSRKALLTIDVQRDYVLPGPPAAVAVFGFYRQVEEELLYMGVHLYSTVNWSGISIGDWLNEAFQ